MTPVDRAVDHLGATRHGSGDKPVDNPGITEQFMII